jgi:hypothetical protein
VHVYNLTCKALKEFTVARFSKSILSWSMTIAEGQLIRLAEITESVSEPVQAQARELLIEYGRFVLAQQARRASVLDPWKRKPRACPSSIWNWAVGLC